jgi:D-alanyl-D-alanine carboxypeptidase
VRANGPREPVTVDFAGHSGQLFRFASGRHATDHPALRRFHLDRHDGPQGPSWTYGEQTFVPGMPDAPVPRPSPRARSPLVGHYRSYSPWYPEFRIVERGGRLLLVAPGGVEAPDGECELVEVAPGTSRVGADPWLPERLVRGPERDGEVVALERDGLRYSRVFSD